MNWKENGLHKFLHLFLGLTDFWQTIKSAVGKYIEK